MLDDRWLTDRLTEWARYMETLQTVGFGDSTTIWRAIMSPSGAGFRSIPPTDVHLLEVDDEVIKLARVIDKLYKDEDPEIAGPIRYVMALYLFGKDNASTILEVGTNKLYSEVKSGERLIRLALRG